MDANSLFQQTLKSIPSLDQILIDCNINASDGLSQIMLRHYLPVDYISSLAMKGIKVDQIFTPHGEKIYRLSWEQ